MSLYGSSRDIKLMKSFNKELIHDVIEQKIGYYKPKLDQLKVNFYGESTQKFWIGPVLIPCLIERNDQSTNTSDFGPDITRLQRFRFLKDDLENAGILTETGDVVLWENDYYEVDGVVQNQLIVGKSNEYNYSDSVNNFGSSLSIIVQAHYARKEKLGIDLDRL